MKETIALLLAAVMLFAFSSCGKQIGENTSSITAETSSIAAQSSEESIDNETSEGDESDSEEATIESEQEYLEADEEIETLEIAIKEYGTVDTYTVIANKDDCSNDPQNNGYGILFQSETFYVLVNGNLTDRKITWESNNQEGFAVDENGRVTAEGGRRALITAHVENESISFNVFAYDNDGVLPDLSDEQLMAKTEVYTLSEFYICPDALGNNTRLRMADDNYTVRLDETQQFKTTIYVNIFIKRRPFYSKFPDLLPSSVTDLEEFYDMDNVYLDYLAIKDSKYFDREWTSSDTNVATVDEEGTVTLHGRGRTLIKATVFAPCYREGNQKRDYYYLNVE